MQFDENRIAIRERAYIDILDLGLCVLREFFGPILLWSIAGVLPFAALNGWLLWGSFDMDFDSAGLFQYAVWMTLLVIYEIPLATAPVTIYLGHALFTERPGWRVILREWARSLPQLLLYQGLLRLPLAFWPYLNEVILLERNPMRSRGPQGRSTHSRSRALHRGEGGDAFARTFLSACVGATLGTSLWLSLAIVRGMLLNELEFDPALVTFYYPLVLWIVVGYLAVVQFLCYLDLRIRREGWEVELRLRAEQARLARRLT